ncbi:uncharacterized protein LOC110844014 isoform X1 [Folsomia candida]|nr:uncharacterized protein LOC110844014 isoform X1 [Folsomia candida]XP_035703119.1 uncharacterized protein LOC110844014 isoform X1 [Folsomia candida]
MESCGNISRLTINFNKFLFKSRPQFFPQGSKSVLQNLKTLKITSHTKKEKELIYVCENLVFLIDALAQNRMKMVELNFNLSNKGPSRYLDLIILHALMLAHKNCETLSELHIQGRETYFGGSANEDANEEDTSSSGGTRRATEMVKSKKSIAAATESSSSSSSFTNFKSDRKNSATLESTEKYLSRCKWPMFPHLKTTVITLSSHLFTYVQEMMTRVDNVRHLKLEVCSGVMLNCWMTFESIIQTTSHTLCVIKLHNIAFEDYLNTSLDLDFNIFKSCFPLQHLHVSGIKRENRHLPKIKNITDLPKNLSHIELSWMTLNTWQWFRLLRKYKKLNSVTVSYASASEKSFGYFLFVLRWLILLKMTKVSILRMTDFKIKFRNKRTALKKLRNAVSVQIQYLDREETLLLLDRGEEKTSLHSIPSIDSGE